MTAIETLLQVMQELRNPESGCPWDVRQTSASIAGYTLDETHELLDAIARDDTENLKEELGDLLFNIVFHARIAEEKGQFNFDDVAQAISDKMKRRHPHVFGELRGQQVSDEVLSQQWRAIKQQEKKDSRLDHANSGRNSGSAFFDAKQLQKDAAKLGFDWPAVDSVLDKLDEEVEEVKQAIKSNDPAAISEEIGDLIFVCVNIARHCKVNAEMALRQTNSKFDRRFAYVREQMAASDMAMDASQLDAMEAFWQQSKPVVG